MANVKELFGYHLEEITSCKYCKLCAYSYLRDSSEYGYCKLQQNAFDAMHPKIITELHSCDKWEKK